MNTQIKYYNKNLHFFSFTTLHKNKKNTKLIYYPL